MCCKSCHGYFTSISEVYRRLFAMLTVNCGKSKGFPLQFILGITKMFTVSSAFLYKLKLLDESSWGLKYTYIRHVYALHFTGTAASACMHHTRLAPGSTKAAAAEDQSNKHTTGSKQTIIRINQNYSFPSISQPLHVLIGYATLNQRKLEKKIK